MTERRFSGFPSAAGGRRFLRLALAVATCAAAGAAPAAAQLDGVAEWSLRLGVGGAGVEGRSGPAGLLQTGITWPVRERMRVGPVLDVIGIANLNDCPLVPGADCSGPPSPLVAASLRFQGGRTGPYVYAQPSLYFWDDGDNRLAPGAGIGFGLRGATESAFNAELGLAAAFTESPSAIVTLTIGFTAQVRPPRLPDPPVPAFPGDPPLPGNGERTSGDRTSGER